MNTAAECFLSAIMSSATYSGRIDPGVYLPAGLMFKEGFLYGLNLVTVYRCFRVSLYEPTSIGNKRKSQGSVNIKMLACAGLLAFLATASAITAIMESLDPLTTGFQYLTVTALVSI
jgi:hypothetical protein